MSSRPSMSTATPPHCVEAYAPAFWVGLGRVETALNVVMSGRGLAPRWGFVTGPFPFLHLSLSWANVQHPGRIRLSKSMSCVFAPAHSL
jgi:hypothetical protein